MIELSGVSKSYAKAGVLAVDNLSLAVKSGEIFGFIGSNGAGKTTCIKMMVGILHPDKGRVLIDELDMATNALEAKRHIGYVPDNHEIYERLTGHEYLNFLADIYGVSKADREERSRKYLAMFGLENAAGDLIKSYSHGMKQKITLTGALIHQPSVWILDEPLVGLDPQASRLLKDEMRAHCAKGNTVFFSTHVLEVAERLCDRIGIIAKGKLIAVGTLEELRQGGDETLESIFFELTDQNQTGQ